MCARPRTAPRRSPAPSRCMARADVVEARVDRPDGARVAPVGRQRCAPCRMHRVGAHMRREAVTQRIGQPVDERDVAEDVALARSRLRASRRGRGGWGRRQRWCLPGLRHADHFLQRSRDRSSETCSMTSLLKTRSKWSSGKGNSTSPASTMLGSSLLASATRWGSISVP